MTSSNEIDGPPPVAPREFWTIIASTGGLFIVGSMVLLVSGVSTDGLFSNGRLLRTIALELALAFWWVPRLRTRGWTLGCITRPAEPLDLARGFLLVAVSLMGYWAFWTILAVIAPAASQAAAAVRISGDASILVVLVVAVVNPVAEEFLYLGFVANLLRREGTMFAVGASVILRLAVHLYQGPLGVVGNLPLGVIFSGYYLWRNRLWPVVVAHSVLDALALVMIAQGAA